MHSIRTPSQRQIWTVLKAFFWDEKKDHLTNSPFCVSRVHIVHFTRFPRSFNDFGDMFSHLNASAPFDSDDIFNLIIHSISVHNKIGKHFVDLECKHLRVKIFNFDTMNTKRVMPSNEQTAWGNFVWILQQKFPNNSTTLKCVMRTACNRIDMLCAHRNIHRCMNGIRHCCKYLICSCCKRYEGERDRARSFLL